MDMLPGSSPEVPFFDPSVPPDRLRRTISDYARINDKRSRQPLKGVGSIQYDSHSDTFSVGPMFCQVVAHPNPPHFLGPWKTAAEKWAARWGHVIEAIQDGRLYAHHRETAFLIHRWIQHAMSTYPPYLVEEVDTYVVHEDTNAGHILVDSEGSITGLVDWEW